MSESKESIEEKNEKFIEDLISKKSVKNINDIEEKSLTFGDRVSDKIAGIAGSWPFIIGFLIFIVIWIVFNIVQAFNHFDSYPFILLNLALSCIAAIQAPVIMMSQNRQEEKDRIRSEQDFQTDTKCEIIIEEILKDTRKIRQIEKKQNEILECIKKLSEEKKNS